MMINLDSLRSARAWDTPAGALFIPVMEGGAHLVAGLVNKIPVLVALSGESPFEFAGVKDWTNWSGLLAEGRFQVDEKAAFGIQHFSDATAGALVISAAGTTMIVGHSNRQKHPIILNDGPSITDLGDGCVVFPEWQYVMGSEVSPDVLFEKRASND